MLAALKKMQAGRLNLLAEIHTVLGLDRVSGGRTRAGTVALRFALDDRLLCWLPYGRICNVPT